MKWIVVMSLTIFFLVGVKISSEGLTAYRKAEASQSWPFVEGIVKNSEVVRTKDGSIKKGSRYSYRPDILYEYEIDLKKYVSNHIQVALVGRGDPTYAQQTVHRYPAGASVRVYVNPSDPYDSVLEPGLQSEANSLLLLGIGFLFFPTLVFLATLRGKPILNNAAAEEGIEDDNQWKKSG